VVTKEDIDSYIKRLPPTPKIVQETINLLRMSELHKAAEVAKEDPALRIYLKELVNKPVFGFSKEVSDVIQIFSILGVSGSLQAVYGYLLEMLSPDKWYFFHKMNKKLFQDFQAELSVSWGKILKHLAINDKQIEASISLIPSSLIVCEALFNDHKEDVELIRRAKDIDLNTILYKLSGYTVFDVCVMIVQKWELGEEIALILEASSATKEFDDKEIMKLAKWIHLLLFYIISKPQFTQAGLNDYIEFHVEFVADIYEEFMEVMEIQE